MGRYQQGYIFERSGYWWLRYYAHVRQKDGSVKRMQPTHKLAPVCSRYPRKKSVKYLADEFLLDFNNGSYKADSTMTLRQFVDDVFFPTYAKDNWKSSSYETDRLRWNRHIAWRQQAQIRLRDFQPTDGQQLINEIARDTGLSRTSLQRTRSLLSAVFSEAKRQGALGNVPNPIQAVRVPKQIKVGPTKARVTYAYSLDEVKQMLRVIPDPERTIVALAAFTGMRRGEIAALDWADWRGGLLQVNKSNWEGEISDTKTGVTREIPVIRLLAEILSAYRMRAGNPESGPMFQHNGKRISLKNRGRSNRGLAHTLAKNKIPWYGWHAFRRGLGTNLADMGVPKHIIQGILGHKNPATTETYYLKSRQAEVEASMKRLDAALCTETCTDENARRSTAAAIN